MADNWTDWYSGAMAPPDKLPGGGYAPAANYMQAPADIYSGIIAGNPILAQQEANAVAQALASTGRANGKATGGGVAEALAGSGATYFPKDDASDRWGYNAQTGDYELKSPGNAYAVVPGPSNPALAAIAAAAPRPTRFDPVNPLGAPSWEMFDDYVNNLGAFGPKVTRQAAAQPQPQPQRTPAPVAKGAAPMPAPQAQPVLNKTQVALANLAAKPKITAATYTPVPQLQPNGVANPAYRDYTPTYTTDNGGAMPSGAYAGSFTDSLGGTYYDRHLN